MKATKRKSFDSKNIELKSEFNGMYMQPNHEATKLYFYRIVPSELSLFDRWFHNGWKKLFKHVEKTNTVSFLHMLSQPRITMISCPN